MINHELFFTYIDMQIPIKQPTRKNVVLSDDTNFSE